MSFILNKTKLMNLMCVITVKFITIGISIHPFTVILQAHLIYFSSNAYAKFLFNFSPLLIIEVNSKSLLPLNNY